MKLFFVQFFLFLCFHAEAYPDSLKAISHKDTSIAFLLKEQIDSSNWHREKAIELFEKNQDIYNWIKIYSKTSLVWRDQLRQPHQSIAAINQLLEIPLLAPNPRKQWLSIAWSYVNRAYTYGEQLGNYKKAVEDYKIARTIMMDTLQKNDYQVAIYIDQRLGNACTRLGDYEQAIYFLKSSIRVLLSEEKITDAALISCDLGIAYFSAQQSNKAIETYQKALQFKPINAYAKGTLLINLGYTYYQNKNYQLALKTTLQGQEQIKIAIDKKQHRFSRLYLATSYENLALIHQAEQNWTLAQQYFEQNLALILDYYEVVHNREISKSYCLIGYLFLEQEQTEKALDYFQKALKAALPNFEPKSFFDHPNIESFYAENAIYEALEGKAKTFHQLAKVQTTSSTMYLKAALDCYELMAVVEQQLRETYENETSKFIAQEKSQQSIEAAIVIALELYKNTKETVYFEKAFEWTEKSKNLVLLEQLFHHKAKILANIPADLLEKETQLKERLSYYQQELFELKNNTEQTAQEEIQELENQIFQLKKSQQEQLKKLKNYPAYQQIKTQQTSIDVASIQKELSAQQALISYFYGDSVIYTFCISKNDFFVLENPKVRQTTQQLEAFSDIISKKSIDQHRKKSNNFASTLYQLYQLLLQSTLANLEESIDQLLIIPDKQLGYLPFEFLLQTDIQQATFQQANFLLMDYNLSYAYSTTLFFQQKKLQTKPASHLFAGFAPKYQDNNIIVQQATMNNLFSSFFRSGQYNLAGAKKEVMEIANLLGGDSFVHEQATEDTFKKQAINYRILHLAMHSLVEDKNHLFSKLLFTENTINDKEDSYLHAIELYNMCLNAELAVLSACNTGHGQVSKGEGILSLSRAFHSAGVPATVMSLWKVPDKQTADIMINFYKNLKAGFPKDAALRQAKLTYLKEVTAPELAHPFYWAGFILVGNTAAIDMTNYLFFWCFGILGGGILIGLFLKRFY